MIRASLLGEQTAENDYKNWQSSFIETPEYRSVIENKDSTIVVGRRGTGKSAMFYRLKDFWGGQKTTNVIALAPEDYQIIGFRALFKRFEGKYSYARSVSRIVWRYGLVVEMLTHLSKNYKARGALGNYPAASEQAKKWMVGRQDFFARLASFFGPYLKSQQDVDEVIGTLSAAVGLDELEEAFAELLKLSGLRFFILIDRLDEGFDNDETGAAIVSGAIAAISDLNKRYDQVRPLMFQRDNIIRSVQKYDPDYTRNVEGEIITIHWDTFQLQNLVSKRLNLALKFDLENAQKIWDRATANEGSGRELQGRDGFKKCLQFTLYRPRDLLSLLNQAFYGAAREGRSVIVLSDLERTAKTISINRLDDLKKEYKSIIPSIGLAVSVFEGGSPEMTFGEAVSALDGLAIVISQGDKDPAVIQDLEILKSDGAIRALYSVGFLGTHDENSNTFAFCHDGRQPDREFSYSDRILIHPCYWIALNLSRDALAPEEAEQINDEYEIKVTSVSPEIRSQRIGALISSLGSIEEGREAADAFEEWVLTAVQTVFAGHLSNVQRKTNGNAVQRRDVVGTNLAKSSVWKRIEKDYAVRQVVFDAKNYKSVGRDEYRQMSTYLIGPYGRLGFLVTRDDDDALRAGSELDWVREIYHTDSKLIIRISHKFLLKLLSKLRNPEKHDAVDSALSSLMDTYERSYLSLQSTRATPKKK